MTHIWDDYFVCVFLRYHNSILFLSNYILIHNSQMPGLSKFEFPMEFLKI